jgi:hypothetical protein
MRAFYKQYGEGGYSNIFTRFGFSSDAQVDAFMGYLQYLIEFSLRQDNPLENSVMGELVERTVNRTYAALRDTLPLEIVVRNVAQDINAHPSQLDCEYFLKQACSDNS